MRKGTVYAAFNALSVLLFIGGIAGTSLESIHGAKAKEAVYLFRPLMAGVILALTVLKIFSASFFHDTPPLAL